MLRLRALLLTLLYHVLGCRACNIAAQMVQVAGKTPCSDMSRRLRFALFRAIISTGQAVDKNGPTRILVGPRATSPLLRRSDWRPDRRR